MKNYSQDTNTQRATGDDVDACEDEDPGEWSKSVHEITPEEESPVKREASHQEVELVTHRVITTDDDDDRVKMHRQVLRKWIRINASGNSQEIEVDRFTLMNRCSLAARDLRIIESSLTYPATIFSRGKGIVVILDRIGCIIMTDEVLFFKPQDHYVMVLKYVRNLQERLGLQAKVLAAAAAGDTSNVVEISTDQLSSSRTIGSSDHHELPFEFTCLDVILEVASTFLQRQAVELEAEAEPLMDQFTNNSNIRIQTLEQVRGMKTKLVELTGRVTKVRDELEKLLDDHDGMALMCLTQQTGRSESFHDQQSLREQPVDGQEMEILLDAYFLAISSTHNKLAWLREYIDDTEDYMEIQLNGIQNQLMKFTLLLLAFSFVLEICGAVFGTFSMHINTPIYDDPGAFKWVLIFTGVGGAMIFIIFVWQLKHRRLI